MELIDTSVQMVSDGAISVVALIFLPFHALVLVKDLWLSYYQLVLLLPPEVIDRT